jgi:phenol 2-monooxygenase
VIVRPDQHVAHVLPIDAHAQIAAFFARFMLEPESVSPVR